MESKDFTKNISHISKFKNKVFVIKIGGSILQDKKNIKSTIEDFVFLAKNGIKTIIVHGGGKDINDELKIHKIEPKFVDGVRFTDDKTMEIVEMVLSGKVNKSIVEEANHQGLNAIGISGKDANFIQAKKIEKLGNVGEVVKIKTDIINILLESGFIPIISPVCFDNNYKSLNVNADNVAVATAKELKAEKLIFLTDINGVYKDKNDKNTLISTILTKDIENMIKEKVITDGMIPKIKSCGEAVECGIKTIHIINGAIQHSMLLGINPDNNIGTVIKKD